MSAIPKGGLANPPLGIADITLSNVEKFVNYYNEIQEPIQK